MPRPEPGNPRARTTEELLRVDAAGRTSRRLAVAALVLSIVGVGLAAWNVLRAGDGGCQVAAWSTTPALQDMPAGWSIASSQYDIARKSMSFLAPLPADTTQGQAVVYATITCYPDGAADAVARSADASTAAGQLVVGRNDLGDQGFSASDDSGATFLQFRHDRIVVYLAASGEATATEVDQLASAFDRALGGDGGAIAVGTQDVATPAPIESTDPAAPTEPAAPSEVAAPHLESLLPTKVADVNLLVDSATGSMFLGEDQGSRAIAAALRADGRSPDDLGVAQAVDESSATDLSILAVGVTGMTGDKVLKIVLELWLAATGTGVTRDTVTLAGGAYTRIDRGDGGVLDYVIVKDDVVLVITTTNPDLAAAAAATLP